MKRINWNKYKFRCSALPCLMTKARSKSDILSETAKAYLRDVYIAEVYGRERVTTNKFCDKGLLVEQDSLKIVTKVLGKGFLAKNKEHLENDDIMGTPDVVEPNLIDIKSSWDIWTFNAVDEKKATSDYYWQLFGYMWLKGRKASKLIYALVNTPEEIINDEIYKLSFKVGEEKARGFEKNYIFDDIAPKKRVKIFNFKFENEKIDDLVTVLSAAREYLKTIKL